VATNTGGAIFIRLGRRNTNAPTRTAAGRDDTQRQSAGACRKIGCQIHKRRGRLKWSRTTFFPSSIVGLPGCVVRNVRLEKLQIIHPGGADAKVACVVADKLDAVPEKPEAYSEFTMFGELPAWDYMSAMWKASSLIMCDWCGSHPTIVPLWYLMMFGKQNWMGLRLRQRQVARILVFQNVQGAIFNQNRNSTISREKIHFNKGCDGIEGLK